ncbi:Plasmid stabilization system protein [Aminobacter sp. MSH1]|uniref:type II toxin-antitoxin system RelE family toxin n=1 Tax=Aminobacter sp. MSH1 TaxID=374606 RepID=UPI000D3C2771|nr:type II toxin-antitoxin system RelE/ParE family toxin [Aminobacter sp. MSH1]AWC25551.1 Plasmid stabilization system protein [Aminobacter sp. MSH1]
MIPTQIIFSPSAERDIKRLIKERQKDVMAALKKLRDGSETLEIEKIKGFPSFFRIKAGREMRIIYHPLTTSRIVVLVIRDRKEAYRGLNGLNKKLEATLHKIEAEAKSALGLG